MNCSDFDFLEKENRAFLKGRVIKSISFDQHEIIRWIIKLYIPSGRIDLDATYSIGNFYRRGVSKPDRCFDIIPQFDFVEQKDAAEINLEDLKGRKLKSVMFDPPFTWGKGKDGKMKKRFLKFENEKVLFRFYYDCIRNFYDLLENEGVFVFKCQDICMGGKQYFIHVGVINEAIRVGFQLEDLFVLLARNRMTAFNWKIQRHARKFHSYFLVFRKKEKEKKE